LPVPLHALLGLAPFLRRSIAGADMPALARDLLAQAQADGDDAALLLDLATALFCVRENHLARQIQDEALTLARTYRLPARRHPARLTLLMLMAPGDLASNTPLECLLEDCDIELVLHYLDPQSPSLAPLPPHDALFVAVGEFDRHLPLLTWLDKALAAWPRPVLNRPQAIPNCARDRASALLRGQPGIAMPVIHRCLRQQLAGIADGSLALATVAPGSRLPLIVRPVGSQAGQGLERIADLPALAAYLANYAEEEFYLADFVDYAGADGLYRKARVVLVDDAAYVAHMATSTHWMVHYVNAGMYEHAERRTEEARFMVEFDQFARRHAAALQAIRRASELDYLCIDCAETADGRLLVFEIGNAMVVHAMDPVEQFPYKAAPIARIVEALRALLLRRVAAGA
jgi:glutathione synthase/RimK-type ligase-like ATP-grasp enzyme